MDDIDMVNIILIMVGIAGIGFAFIIKDLFIPIIQYNYFIVEAIINSINMSESLKNTILLSLYNEQIRYITLSYIIVILSIIIFSIITFIGLMSLIRKWLIPKIEKYKE